MEARGHIHAAPLCTTWQAMTPHFTLEPFTRQPTGTTNTDFEKTQLQRKAARFEAVHTLQQRALGGIPAYRSVLVSENKRNLAMPAFACCH